MTYRSLGGVVFLLALGACGVTAPSERVPVAPSPTIAAAITRAMACGVTHGYRVRHPVATLRFWADPGEANGITWGRDIVMRPDLWQHERMVAHELLHAVFRIRGHPRIFAACGLAMEQF
jgi:hypothetical protein